MSAEGSNPTRWSTKKELYPAIEVILKGFNDRGVTKKGKTKYPDLEKLCGGLHGSLMTHCNKPDGLDSNKTRGKRKVAEFVLNHRKAFDSIDVAREFHSHALNGKVMLIKNDLEHAGLDVVIDALQDYCVAASTTKNSARTHNDGLRAALIMLDPRHRSSISKYVSNTKKGRKASDQSGDVNENLFEHLLVDFNDTSYVAAAPREEFYDRFDEEDRARWDPNDISIFEQERSPLWLKETWEKYVRPKYRHSLDKWNKDTGGGDGTPPSFVDFCGRDKWLVYIFCVDYDANMLLASPTGGCMPRHLTYESGFDAIPVPDGEDDSPPRNKGAVIEKQIETARKQIEEVGTTMQNIGTYLKSKEASPTKDIKSVTMLSNLVEDPPESLTPTSKALFCDEVKAQRKVVLERMLDRKRKREATRQAEEAIPDDGTP